jgi:hypothetical protein
MIGYEFTRVFIASYIKPTNSDKLLEYSYRNLQERVNCIVDHDYRGQGGPSNIITGYSLNGLQI